MKKKLRIAIATSGRFHVLDLARELDRLGHEIRFYSYVPKRRTVRYGLPAQCYVSLFPWVLPIIVLERLLGKRTSAFFRKIAVTALDWLVCRTLRPCDVFISMSGMYVKAARLAKVNYGAQIFVERGSRHILSQYETLKAISSADLPSKFDIERELASYDVADKVVIPALHVRNDFLERGFPQDLLFINPYGVDTKRFKPGRRIRRNPAATAIFVGSWSLLKGVDLLVAAVSGIPDLTLLHVGRIVDYPFPSGNSAFIHHDAVDQMQLPSFYSRANIFVSPSREEGLSLVIAQALACGLPAVCTTRTGGADLAQFMDHPEAMIVVEPNNVNALVDGIRQALQWSQQFAGCDLLGKQGRKALGWAAYGRRYHEQLIRPK